MSGKHITLRAQLNFIIIFMLVLSFAGSVWINVVNTKSFLNAQLTSHAQDTATSLGLSLRASVANKEMAEIEATINAIFDRGFYHHIILEDPYGKLIYDRVNNNQPEQIPSWFIELFQLTAPEKTSMVDTGWTVGAVLKVQSHTGAAYAQLWNSANDFTYATLFIFILALFLGYLVLKQVYKPINAISLQASAIQKREFVLIERLPRAKELNNFVKAMNHMVSSIKNTFDELTKAAERTRKDAYVDVQTGIANRRAFNDLLAAALSRSEEQRGFLLMVRVTGLADYNKQHGYTAGDDLIAKLIKYIQREQEKIPETTLCRLSGAELGFLINNQAPSQIELLAEALVKQFHRHIEMDSLVNVSVAAVPFQSGERNSDVMYRLDAALNLSIESSQGFHVALNKNKKESVGSATAFKAIIESIIEFPEHNIQIMTQKVQDYGARKVYQFEVFTGFNYQGQVINTGDVFAMAAQYQLTSQLDQAILNKVIARLPNLSANNEKVAVNLSRLTFTNIEAMNTIIETLKISEYAPNIVIGLTESAVSAGFDEAHILIDKLNQAGCLISINRFGSSIESLQYLMKVRPHFVKLETAYTRSIHEKSDNQQLVGEFIRLAHGLDIPVIAQSVENEQELATLQKVNIDGVLGYVIAKPQFLKEK